MNEELIKMIESGIELEKQGLRRYLELARKSTVAEGKNLFIMLASDEVDHMELLENLKANVLKGSYTAPKLEVYNVKELLPKLEKGHMEVKGEKQLTELDALKLALEFEKRASEFYEKLADATNDPETKKFAMDLARWEESHYDLLQAQLDELKNTGFYFNMMEFDLAHLRG